MEKNINFSGKLRSVPRHATHQFGILNKKFYIFPSQNLFTFCAITWGWAGVGDGVSKSSGFDASQKVTMGTTNNCSRA